ncbi:MAG: serpin family protein [Pseudomonadota bacterium]
MRTLRTAKTLITTSLALLGLGLWACTPIEPTPQNDDGPGTLVRSDKERNLSPAVEASDVTAQVRGNTQFGIDMYQALRAGTVDNVFFSPYSISIALAMTDAGALGNTATEMADAMDYVLAQDRLHPVFNHLDLELNSRGQGAAGQDGEGFRLHVVNAIWGQDGYGFLAPFLDTLAINYGAGLRLLDFATQTEVARQTINGWVEEQTEQRIQDLIPAGALDSLTRLVLTNAIYFNAAWAEVFAEESTSQATFSALDGSSVPVQMMHQTTSFKHLDTADLQAVELPYDGGELAMLILLPAAGQFSTFEDALTAESLQSIVDSMSDGEVILSLPRWTFGTPSITLRDVLQGLGMHDAFVSGTADFSGMDGSRELFIGNVLHKAFISVNEKGTEAAAATAVVMEGSGMPSGPYITCDRPFIYAIRDLATGTVLFLGRVTRPEA